jgi:hypothetical protein
MMTNLYHQILMLPDDKNVAILNRKIAEEKLPLCEVSLGFVEPLCLSDQIKTSKL